MPNITVYRYEAKIKDTNKFYGMFSINHYDKSFEQACSQYRRNIKGYTKEPEEDGCIGFQRGMLSGCTSFHQLLKWGSVVSFKELETAGFKLSKYEVPEEKLIKGETQVVFRPEHAKFIGHTSISEFKQEYRNNKRKRRSI